MEKVQLRRNEQDETAMEKTLPTDVMSGNAPSTTTAAAAAASAAASAAAPYMTL